MSSEIKHLEELSEFLISATGVKFWNGHGPRSSFKAVLAKVFEMSLCSSTRILVLRFFPLWCSSGLPPQSCRINSEQGLEYEEYLNIHLLGAACKARLLCKAGSIHGLGDKAVTE